MIRPAGLARLIGLLLGGMGATCVVYEVLNWLTRFV